MGLRKVILANGETYHVFNRGVAQQPIFNETRNYSRITELLDYYRFFKLPLRFSHFHRLIQTQQEVFWESVIKRSSPIVEIITYCFMPNHIHLLLKQQGEGGISKFMANFLNSYARYFNIKYNRVGALFQANFKAVRIENDEQLLHVNRYIHLNPVTSYIVEIDDLGKYPCSSFPYYLNLADNHFVETKLILGHFKNRESYKKFVLDQADYQRKLLQIRHLTLEG